MPCTLATGIDTYIKPTTSSYLHCVVLGVSENKKLAEPLLGFEHLQQVKPNSDRFANVRLPTCVISVLEYISSVLFDPLTSPTKLAIV